MTTCIYQIRIGTRETIDWPLICPPTAEMASKVYEGRREKSGEGASTFPRGSVVATMDGRVLMNISYNAKVWDNLTGELLFDPYAEISA